MGEWSETGTTLAAVGGCCSCQAPSPQGHWDHSVSYRGLTSVESPVPKVLKSHWDRSVSYRGLTSVLGPELGPSKSPQCKVQSWEACHDVSKTTLRYRSQMRVCELQKRQWATPANLGISSQIVICLLLACNYLRYTVPHLCRTQKMEEEQNAKSEM